MKSHPTLTSRIGTTEYYFHCSNPEFQYPNNKFSAKTEEVAKKKVLQILNAKPKGEWEFRGECSKNRGFTCQTNRCEITLWHILRC